MAEVGSLSIPVRADLGPLNADLDRLRRQLGVTENQTRGLTREMSRMSVVTQSLTGFIRGAGLALAASFGGRVIIGTLASLEESMAAVAAVTRSTEEELSSIRDVVKELGATTEFTASQVADGFKFLGLAGFTAAESIAAIPQVLDLATSASMGLARAADIASNIMSAFGIAASNAAEVTDVLAAANARANTSIEQLGDGMKYVGPIAQSLGISVNDTAAAIGTLSNSGIQGSMAGTGLRRVLSSLVNATPQATRVLRDMGLTLEELNPTSNSLVDIVQRLADAGLNAEQAFTIFGDRGGPAISTLVENVSGLRELTGELQNVEGAASEMARTMRDQLGGDLKNLQSAIEAVVIAMGESGLTGVLRSTTQALTEVFRFIAENMDTVRNSVVGLAIAFSVQYVASVGAATAATAAFSGALRILRLAIAGTGIGAIAIILGDVAFKLYEAATAADELGESIEGVTEPARTLFDFLKDGADLIYATFDYLTSGIAAFFVGAFATIYENYANLINSIREGFDALGLTELLGMTPGFRLDPNSLTNLYNDLEAQTDAAFERVGLLAQKLAGEEVPELFDVGAVFDSLNSEEFDSVEELYEAWREKTVEVKEATTGLTEEQQKLADAYRDIIAGGREFIAAQELERQAIGLTELEANKLRYAFELLNEAERAGIAITPAVTEELTNLAHQMAEAEEATNRLRDAYDFAQDTFKGFFTDLKTELQNGASIWEAFGTAAVNALQKIADRALDLALSGIFDMIFGAFTGGGGNFLSGLLGFENGTSFAPGGVAVVGERGPELVHLPGGSQVIPNNRVIAPSQASFGGGGSFGTSRVALDVFVKDDGKIGAIARQEAGAVVETTIRDYDTNQLPDSVQRISTHPRMRHAPA